MWIFKDNKPMINGIVLRPPFFLVTTSCCVVSSISEEVPIFSSALGIFSQRSRVKEEEIISLIHESYYLFIYTNYKDQITLPYFFKISPFFGFARCDRDRLQYSLRLI